MEETTGGLLLMTSSIFPEATRSQLNPVTPPRAQSKAWDSFIFSSLFLFWEKLIRRSSPWKQEAQDALKKKKKNGASSPCGDRREEEQFSPR